MPDNASAPLRLTLPDGAVREVPPGTLPSDVVAGIGERLLNAAVAVSVDGAIQDLRTPLRSSGAFRVYTDKDAESVPVLRHSSAHILATAVRRLRPDAALLCNDCARSSRSGARQGALLRSGASDVRAASERFRRWDQGHRR